MYSFLILILITLLNFITCYYSKNYYHMLGINQTASFGEIKKAFKKLVQKYHPDKNPNDREKAREKFTEITNMYEVISDPEKRKEYDLYLRLVELGENIRGKNEKENSHKYQNSQTNQNYLILEYLKKFSFYIIYRWIFLIELVTEFFYELKNNSLLNFVVNFINIYIYEFL
jgi:curved DNA-binding protein CbpA